MHTNSWVRICQYLWVNRKHFWVHRMQEVFKAKILAFCVPVTLLQSAFAVEQSKNRERVQKLCLKIILGDVYQGYDDALEKRREAKCPPSPYSKNHPAPQKGLEHHWPNKTDCEAFQFHDGPDIFYPNHFFSQKIAPCWKGLNTTGRQLFTYGNCICTENIDLIFIILWLSSWSYLKILML